MPEYAMILKIEGEPDQELSRVNLIPGDSDLFALLSVTARTLFPPGEVTETNEWNPQTFRSFVGEQQRKMAALLGPQKTGGEITKRMADLTPSEQTMIREGQVGHQAFQKDDEAWVTFTPQILTSTEQTQLSPVLTGVSDFLAALLDFANRGAERQPASWIRNLDTWTPPPVEEEETTTDGGTSPEPAGEVSEQVV